MRDLWKLGVARFCRSFVASTTSVSGASSCNCALKCSLLETYYTTSQMQLAITVNYSLDSLQIRWQRIQSEHNWGSQITPVWRSISNPMVWQDERDEICYVKKLARPNQNRKRYMCQPNVGLKISNPTLVQLVVQRVFESYQQSLQVLRSTTSNYRPLWNLQRMRAN